MTLNLEIAKDLPVINDCEVCEGKGYILVSGVFTGYSIPECPVVCHVCKGKKNE